jgi:very-short-patch-repair endonuclease
MSEPQSLEFRFEADGNPPVSGTIVPIGGTLPCSFKVPTGKLLDVILALSASGRSLTGKARQKARQKANAWLYNRTRPGFCFMVKKNVFHIAYAGQPDGAGTQHQWHIFCIESYQQQVELLIHGTALTTPTQQSQQSGTGGNYTKEWGGLYLRSEAEVRIAEALDQTGLLYFANARGRVGLKDTVVSNNQLTGRVEADFMVFYRGTCLILEVDGQHHNEQGNTVRDYARDRVLLRAGVPTVRFTAKDCFEHPQKVVSEFLSILYEQQRSTEPATHYAQSY